MDKFFLPTRVTGPYPAPHVLDQAVHFMMQLHIWLGEQLVLFKRSFQNRVEAAARIETAFKLHQN